jgi:hypothetical protein
VKICFVAPYYDARRATPDHTAYLEQFPIHSELPRAVAALGHTVDMVYHYPYAGRLERDGVRHWFEPPGVGAHQLGRLAQRSCCTKRVPSVIPSAARNLFGSTRDSSVAGAPSE